ncbi:sulfatase-like hydrolase/transferase [Halolamina sp. C58]|uniref:sulfatase-like hydrolase/transferase n=1 Tax=Halolamina sp. C58 TaxID=3421640 RepID=UPI003EBEE094
MQNVLLVTVDSLRADRVTDRVMPETAAFEDGTVSFTDAVANGPSTPASFPAIHASRHFASIEGLGIPESGGGIVTLAEQLSEAGYDTAGFTDNHFASGDYHFGRGFDTLHDASGSTEAGRLKQFVQSNLDKEGSLFRTIESVYTRVDGLLSTATGNESEYERAASLNRRAIEWIDDRDGPWFVWLHYMDVHHPYEAPDAYQEAFLDTTRSVSECRALSRKATHHPSEMTDEEWTVLTGLYDAECAYTDAQFRTLLDSLSDMGVREETVTLFTADHGELLGEHGKGGHPPEFWEGTIRVPFVLEGTGNTGEHDGQIRLLDTAPTLTDAVEVDAPPEWQGESALELDDGEGREVAFGDVGRDVDYGRCYVRRADGWKLLRHADNGEHLFDVHETPAERVEDDRLGEELAEESDLGAALDRHSEEMAAMRSGARAVGEESEMVEDHLEALGYK